MDSAFMCSVTQDLWKTNAAPGKSRTSSDGSTPLVWTAWIRNAVRIHVKTFSGNGGGIYVSHTPLAC